MKEVDKKIILNIPKTIKVGGRHYTITCSYKFRERNDLYGHCNHARQELLITADDGNGNSRTIEGIWITVIHEILHAIDHVYCAERCFSGEEGEKNIEGISEGIYQVLFDLGMLTEKSEFI